MFDNLKGLIWMDGKIIDWSSARCHIMTHALHYASSVYEGIRSYDGKLFKGIEHYERLHTSAEYLDFKVPYKPEELVHISQKIIKKQKFKEGYIRAISWCGSKVMTVSHNNSNVHTAIAIWERPVIYDDKIHTEGIRMNIAKWRRPDPRTAPVHSKASGLYMISSMSKKSSEKLGYNDSLMLDYENNIAEATSSNIFMVIGKKLFTPIPNSFLNGITRQIVIKIAKKMGITVCEKAIPLQFLNEASEVFLTGTAVEVLPVGIIESKKQKWMFRPSDITNNIRKEYNNMTRGND